MAAANAKATGSTASLPPSQSLYIQNLNEKLQKYDLRRALYMLFATFGPVLDVTALKTAKMRGQAHVLFRDVHSASQAMKQCQGMEFFGRQLIISYAKARSKTLAKMTGVSVEAEQAKQRAAQPAQPPSSFPAPPGSSLPPPPGLPSKPGTLQAPVPAAAPDNAPSPAGTKRQRDESEDEDGDAPMEEDSEGGEMEMSDDDD